MLKLASLGNVKSQTLRAFCSNEMETIMKKAARAPKNRISTKKPYAHSRQHAFHPERMEITEPRVVPRFVPAGLPWDRAPRSSSTLKGLRHCSPPALIPSQLRLIGAESPLVSLLSQLLFTYEVCAKNHFSNFSWTN